MLDTNICIYLIKRKPVSLLERFQQIQPGEISLSIVTVAELTYGVQKSVAVEKNRLALEQFLIPFNILPFDGSAAQTYGIVRAQLEKQGRPIGPLDTLIAAHALAHGQILVTNNEKEFDRIEGLFVENWTLQS